MTRSRLTGLRGALLDAISEGPPPFPGERYFGADLQHLGPQELQAEHQRLRLRLLLTDPHEREHWPASWVANRLRRVEEELLRANGQR